MPKNIDGKRYCILSTLQRNTTGHTSLQICVFKSLFCMLLWIYTPYSAGASDDESEGQTEGAGRWRVKGGDDGGRAIGTPGC